MSSNSVREKWRHIIFGTDTPAGRLFDQLVILAILTSVVAVMLDSIAGIHDQYGKPLFIVEWFFTLAFTAEYIVRLWVSERPTHYARSFFGIVDLLAILPSYLSLFIPGANFLLTIRILRVMRVFRVLRLLSFMSEATTLTRALIRARRKIAVFMLSVSLVIVVFGSLMYLVEGPENGFTSIPKSIYWAIVTVTTVGYGDISPNTPLGQIIAALAMFTGYAIIAVPTGIVTAEITQAVHAERFARECSKCHLTDHQRDARYCRNCGNQLSNPRDEA